MKNIYSTFEFNLIKERLLKHATVELAKKYVEDLSMFDSKEELEDSLTYLNEGIRYANKYGRLNIYYHPNLIPNLVSIKKGGIGSKEFFYQVGYLLENIKLIKEEFKESEVFVLIDEIVKSLNSLDQVKARIDRVFSPSLDILDSASPNLYRIRTKILRLESSISSLSRQLVDKYRNYLSDGHGAFKNGIFTLMVKSTYKNRVQGIVHATSDTGQTLFIQPQELIEVYNEIASLKEEELQEIQIILKELSLFISKYDRELLVNNLNIARLDFIFAKATFAISYNGEIAKISNEKKILLKSAAHPLIDPKKVVRNDFIMEKEKMMVITGPNAGGKTVALKVVGLLVIMHQCGLALPIKEGGELAFFDNIFADIGDNQSIIDNLSTFSSHIVNIQDILSKVDSHSLVIIDELGSGTSPLDGEAIGLGVIDYLLNKNCFSMISSHYEALKTYALENDDILCASMIFDEKEIRPTYQLLLHVASSSYGIEVAERFGLNNEVISRAKKYLEERKLSDKEIRLEVLNAQINEVEKLKKMLLLKEEELQKEQEKLRVEIQKNRDLRNEIIQNAEDEKRLLVEKAKEEMDEIFKEFKSLENVKLHQLIDAKKKLENNPNLNDEDDEEDIVCNIGDSVEVIASKARGKVTRLDKNRATILLDGGLTLQVKLNQIRKVTVVKPNKKKTYTPDIISNMKRVSTECNVIGMTVKEAIEVISKYLDDCTVVHYKQCRIIHGCGTGKLRSGVHEYLKKCPYVESYRLGGMGEGGVGATVVTLK